MKTFLICSLSGRLNNLLYLIDSLGKYTSWNVCVVLQKYSAVEAGIVQDNLNSVFPGRNTLLTMDKMTGPHLARCSAFDIMKSDVWCILDDDMWAVEGFTNYDKMADILIQNKNIGILSSNWRKTEKLLGKVNLRDSLVKQNIVYTGGGMMLRDDLIQIIKAIPRVQYLFDNPLWSIYSYVNGYDNYRYMGSAAVHQICTKGGRRKWITESNSHKVLPPPEWIATRRGKGNEGGFDEYLICDSHDITDLAHELHEKNRKV